MQLIALIGGSGKDDQLPLRRFAAPALQLLKAIAPVPTAAEQSHHYQSRRLGGGVEVVVQLRRMVQAAQGQSPDPFVPGRVDRQACVEAADVGACAGEEQHIRARLLNENHIFRWVQTRTGGEAMHGPILRVEVLGGEKIQRSDPSR